MDIRFKRHAVVQTLHTREFHRTYRGRLFEFHFYPMWLSVFNRWKTNIVFLSFHQFTPWETSVSFHLFPFQWLTSVSFWSRESQYSNIPIVAPFFFVRFRNRKQGLYLFACYIGTAINDGTHCIFRLNPRTTRHGPSRTVLHSEAQTQAFAFICGMFYSCIPIFAHTLYIFGRSWPLAAKLAME